MNVHRLRSVPTIEFEPQEGRLRRTAGEPTLREAQGADTGRPRWRQDLYDLQMKTKIAVTLLDELFTNLRTLEDIYEISLRDNIGLDELSFHVHDLKRTAEALQPN